MKHKKQFEHVGLHPLAGSEGQGWQSARADLFVKKRIVCTPTAMSRQPIVRELIGLLGATPLPMEARTHDRLVAEAIGLPHILAYAVAGMSGANPLRAGSWASLTRVASSSPEMVAGFLSINATEQTKVITRFERELAQMKRAIKQASGARLRELLVARQQTED